MVLEVSSDVRVEEKQFFFYTGGHLASSSYEDRQLLEYDVITYYGRERPLMDFFKSSFSSGLTVWEWWGDRAQLVRWWRQRDNGEWNQDSNAERKRV